MNGILAFGKPSIMLLGSPISLSRLQKILAFLEHWISERSWLFSYTAVRALLSLVHRSPVRLTVLIKLCMGGRFISHLPFGYWSV